MKKIKSILLVCNILVAILLIIIFLSKNKSPAENIIFSAIPIAYIICIFINFIFILIWIFIKQKYILISFIAIISTISFINRIIPLQSYINFTNNDTNTTTIKIMSYNVNVFGLYNWNDNTIKPQILKLIKDEKPDILCLQEAFWTDEKSNFVTIDSLKKYLNTNNVFKFAISKAVANQNFGLAIISKFSIINKYSYKFENSGNGFCYVDILQNNDTIRIYNLHLQSIYFGKDDYIAIKNISTTDSIKTDFKEMVNVLKKYLKSCRQRAIQSDLLKQNIDSCKYKIFVCGDFNDLALSYSYNTIKGNLIDSYCKRGRFSDFTWSYGKFKQRIDYMFFDKSYICKTHKTIKKQLSDHQPIIAEFSLKK